MALLHETQFVHAAAEGAPDGSPMRMVVATVLLDPEQPDLLLTVQLPDGGAHIGWLKDELCRQDPTSTTTAECFCICAEHEPSVPLDENTPIAPALGTLVVRACAQAMAGAADGPTEDERERIESRAAQKALEEQERRARASRSAPPSVQHYWQKRWEQGAIEEYTFAPGDPSWVKYLKRHGFCVLEGVLPDPEFCETEALFWSDMAKVVPGLSRHDPSTWNFPGQDSSGITRAYGLPHGDFAWTVRTHPEIRRVFELIFRTNELVVSMDSLKLVGTGVQEPGEFWLHRDQLKDVAPYSVQSIFALYEVGPENDGTILIPDSHRESHHWDEWQRAPSGAVKPMLRAYGRERNNVRVPPELQERFMARAIKPHVPSNGLILFCSRTIHASSPDAGVRWLRERGAVPKPNRVAMSVSMCPRARRSAQARAQKLALAAAQCSTTHWADDEALRGKTWGRDEGQPEKGAGFRPLPPSSLELRSQRMRWL